MTTRDEQLLANRPFIPSIVISKNMSHDERFQNITLRPIIKLQQDLFLEVFKNYIHKHKNVFYELTIDRRLNYIENAIQKDIKFRNALKGMVIGQFTTDEYLMYIENSSDLNKRMMHIVIRQLQTRIQLLEKTNILLAG